MLNMFFFTITAIMLVTIIVRSYRWSRMLNSKSGIGLPKEAYEAYMRTSYILFIVFAVSGICGVFLTHPDSTEEAVQSRLESPLIPCSDVTHPLPEIPDNGIDEDGNGSDLTSLPCGEDPRTADQPLP